VPFYLKYLSKKVRLVNMKRESELVTVSTKGQVVIPQTLRHELGLTPKTKLLVYGKRDAIILRKIKIPKIYKDWGKVFDIIEKKNLKLTARDVQKEIEDYRRGKKSR